ncbi:hypothetical protein RIF29_41388 [Crotalaria pallida]|uniref:Uncharacterized protein n=1 Tax=Crotalaria pallida TaxID=3830 RepID=A0AAN9E5B4_CROPI
MFPLPRKKQSTVPSPEKGEYRIIITERTKAASRCFTPSCSSSPTPPSFIHFLLVSSGFSGSTSKLN